MASACAYSLKVILLAISSIAHEHFAIKSLFEAFEDMHANTNSDRASVGKSFE
jgi:hypothetical protein